MAKSIKPWHYKDHFKNYKEYKELSKTEQKEANVKEARKELAWRELSRRKLSYFTQYCYPGFIDNWHLQEIFQALEDVESGKLKRLAIFMPPRHGKSIIASVHFPAWCIGRNKDLNIIQASYNAELATDFGREVRNLVQTKEFQNVFKDVQVAEDSQSKGKWNTNGRGAYIATGVGGSLTGRGANILLIDDPVKNREEADSETVREATWNWYRSTARTRLAPGGSIVLIQTRWHLADLAGRLLEDGDQWKVLSYPAIAEQDEPKRKMGEALWPERYPLPELEQIKKDIGIYEFTALYQQTPIATENQDFKAHWIRKMEWADLLKKQTTCFISIDTAVSQRDSADYTGIIRNFVDENGNWHIAATRKRMNPTQLVEDIFALYQNDRPAKIGIEKTVFLQAIKPFLEIEMRRRNIFIPITELEHKQTQKETRIRSLIPRYETGSVYHLVNQTKELEEEMFTFPQGKHDDVLDALAYQSQLVTKRKHGVKQFRPKWT